MALSKKAREYLTVAITNVELAKEIADSIDLGGSGGLSQAQIEALIQVAIDDLVAGAPTALDTLNELSAALGDDADFATNVLNAIGDKANTADLAAVATSGDYNDLSNQPNLSHAQTLFVTKNGNDLGDGSFDKPLLTIGAALTAIIDASPSKRYMIHVGVGEYSEAISLKANVFIVGTGQKELVRIIGAVSLHPSFSGSADNRSGFSNVSLLSACDFNWQTVTSAAGKLYFNEVLFSSTINMYGHNNSIAQAQFNGCIIFGAMTISGINVGVYSNCVNFSNITMNQHPNGGMATILSMAGGYCSGTVNLVTTVNDFNRRCSLFARSFWMNALTVNGAASYADVTDSSLPPSGPTALNGGNVIYINPSSAGANTFLSNLSFPTAVNNPIIPANSSVTNFGDWGKQWAWNFGYVHASTGSDCYLISYPSSYGADSSGKNVGIYADGAGLQANANGGDVDVETAAVSGSGIRGKIRLSGRVIDHDKSPSTNFVLESGDTASRPLSPVIGQMYFDTTLNIPIWYKGTGWINALGTSV